MSIRVYKTTLKNTHLGVSIKKPDWSLYTQFIIDVEKTPATNSIAPSNAIALAELEFYDSEQNKISYTTTSTDIVNNVSDYWNGYRGMWDRANLSDGAKTFSDFSTGEKNATIICSVTNGYGWGRFLVNIPTANVDEIRYYVSLEFNRMPEYFRVYAIPTDVAYNRTRHLAQRNTSDLVLVWEHHNDYSNRQTNMVFSSKE